MAENRREIWLCLSGGNALGSYHAGAYEALDTAGLAPARIAGASIGALTGALIAGNPPSERLNRLRQFWERVAQPVLPGVDIASPLLTKHLSLWQTLSFGRHGLFRPDVSKLWSFFHSSKSSSIFDPSPLRRTLTELVDFGRLTNGPVRLLVTAVDVETGEDKVFDSHRDGIGIDELLASAALPIAFPPVCIAGRFYVDAGVSANLPIVPLFADVPDQDVLCLALDLVAPQGRVPASLDDAIGRAHDLVLSSQSRHSLCGLMRSRELFAMNAATVVHLPYEADNVEIGGKSFEFSSTSVQRRWSAGTSAAQAALASWVDVERTDGLSIFRLSENGLLPLQCEPATMARTTRT